MAYSASQKVLGLVNDIWLGNASFSLPKWQAVKMIFFAPSTVKLYFNFGDLFNRSVCRWDTEIACTWK